MAGAEHGQNPEKSMSLNCTTSKRTGRLAASALSICLLASACGSDAQSSVTDTLAPVTTDVTGSDSVAMLSAADGAAARTAQQAALGGVGGLQTRALSAESSGVASAFAGECGTPYEPTAGEIAEANDTTAALAEALDTFGITHSVTTDEFGFSSIETDYDDVVAQSVVDSFWQERFPVDPIDEDIVIEPEPIDPAELARQSAESDKIVAALEAIGVDYTRESDDSGWEWVEWDYDNREAQVAVDAVYAELYPPIPPTADDLAAMKAENDRLAAAFDAAGIAYSRVADEAGWEWIEWDYEDESTWDAVNALFTELYPVEPGLPCVEPLGDVATTGASSSASVTSELAPDDLELVAVEPFTSEEIAQRDADVAALSSGFGGAGVAHDVWGESPWASVTFELSNEDAIEVVARILAERS